MSQKSNSYVLISSKSSYLVTLNQKVYVTKVALFGMGYSMSKPQLNHNSTQPNITWWDAKMNLHTAPPSQKLHVSNISAVTDPILMKLL